MFTTKELAGKDHQRVLVRLQPGLKSELTELSLEVSTLRIKKVYNFLKDEGLTSTAPEQIYKAIYTRFIKEIKEFTLGDWRKIVNLVEPGNPVPTRKAWSLYTEAIIRHNNRMAALRAIEKRDLAEHSLRSQSENSSSQGFIETNSLPTAQQIIAKNQFLGTPY